MGIQKIISFAVFTLIAVSSWSAPLVGRKAMAPYFPKNSNGETRVPQVESPRRTSSPGEHLLMLGAGASLSSEAFEWKGRGRRDGVSQASYGGTYLLQEWNGLDLNFRFDFNEYKIDEEGALKLSLLPLLTFPRFASGFPLYFGIGLGPGVFLRQVKDESNVTFDYQLVAGGRSTQIFEGVGFFAEYAMKNHLHLLSSGQAQSQVLSVGAAFAIE